LKRLFLTLLILFSLFSADASQDAESMFEQGIEAFNSGNYGSSELIFRKIIESSDDEIGDRAWFYLSRSIYHQKKYKSSIFEFNNLFVLICISL